MAPFIFWNLAFYTIIRTQLFLIDLHYKRLIKLTFLSSFVAYDIILSHFLPNGLQDVCKISAKSLQRF